MVFGSRYTTILTSLSHNLWWHFDVRCRACAPSRLRLGLAVGFSHWYRILHAPAIVEKQQRNTQDEQFKKKAINEIAVQSHSG